MTNGDITRYVRFTAGGAPAYGILDGDTIRELAGDLFADPQPNGRTHRLADVQLLLPLDPSRVSKVIGVAVNYHPEDQARTAAHPKWFAKLPTSLNPHEGDVEWPPEAANFNYEGELV